MNRLPFFPWWKEIYILSHSHTRRQKLLSNVENISESFCCGCCCYCCCCCFLVCVCGFVLVCISTPWGWVRMGIVLDRHQWQEGVTFCVGGAKNRERLSEVEKCRDIEACRQCVVSYHRRECISWRKASEISQSSGAFLRHSKLHSFTHSFSSLTCDENTKMNGMDSDFQELTADGRLGEWIEN